MTQRLRKLLAAVVAVLLAPASAFAQPAYSPGQTGAVGTIVTATDPNGRPRQVVEPHIICDSGCSSSGSVGTQAYSGQLTLSASAAALSTGLWTPSAPTSLIAGLVCKAPISNTGTVYIGPSGVSSSNGYPLNPGDAISYAIASAASLYALDSTTTDILVCTGS